MKLSSAIPFLIASICINNLGILADTTTDVDATKKSRSSLRRGLANVNGINDTNNGLFSGVDVDSNPVTSRSDNNSNNDDNAFECESIVATAGTRDPTYDRSLVASDNNLFDDFSEAEEFACQTNTGEFLPLEEGEAGQLNSLRRMLNGGEFVSGEMTIEGLTLGTTSAALNGGDTGSSSSSSGGAPAAVLPSGNMNALQFKPSTRRRRLANYVGDKQVLVVVVTSSSGERIADTAETVSDKIFGTYGDSVTMKSQFEDCSFNQFRITNNYSKDISQHLAAPGVIEVTIPITLDNSRSTIRNAVTAAVQDKLGYNLPGNFHHVMYVLQTCIQSCGWAAYAYVNSWNSVYQGNYYKYVGVQVHEIGHNLNLAHSGGLNGATYTDHTCMMGNPLYSDNIGKMCFNPAKSYQIVNSGTGSWYTGATSTWDSGTNTPKFMRVNLIGIADYDNNPQGHKVSIKLETGTAEDYFIGFNRATGPNAQNDEADDEVTVITMGNNGVGYSQSFLKATLRQGETYTVTNWRETGKNLVITANAIDIASSPGVADVTVNFDNAPMTTPEPTTALPTKVPTSPPTGPTMAPTNAPTKVPTLFPTSSPTRKPVSCGAKGDFCTDKSECCNNRCDRKKNKCR